jgi:hypothetical protein
MVEVRVSEVQHTSFRKCVTHSEHTLEEIKKITFPDAETEVEIVNSITEEITKAEIIDWDFINSHEIKNEIDWKEIAELSNQALETEHFIEVENILEILQEKTDENL